jgi:hypothetical protein
MNEPAISKIIPVEKTLSRRAFIQNAALGAGAVIAANNGLLSNLAHSSELSEAAGDQAETLVQTLYKSLSEKQRSQVAFPFDHPLRSEIENNWSITEPRLDTFYTPDQQAMVQEIFMKLHSEEYAPQVLRQVKEDSGKRGFGECSIAMFGEPGTGKFEFVLTGRHVTRRCDGDSLGGTAFGGPIFYGHAAQSFDESPDHPGNVYWYQAVKANEVFQMLDRKQREIALLDRPRREQGKKTVELTGKQKNLPGIRASDLTCDQKDKLRETIADVLAPFRAPDVAEAMSLIESAGFDHLHTAFYKFRDLGDDSIWDIWQIEGPSMIMFFRGAPHVHAWIHIKDQA